jgi:predicted transcriptional regulator
MLEKIAELLTVATKPVLKSRIMEKCTLATRQLHYIDQLVEAGLLDAYPAIDLKHISGPKNRRRMVYQTSVKGKEFLKRYNDLLTLLEISAINPRSLNLHVIGLSKR